MLAFAQWPLLLILVIVLIVLSTVSDSATQQTFFLTASATLVGVLFAFYINFLFQHLRERGARRNERQRLLTFIRGELRSNLERLRLLIQAIRREAEDAGLQFTDVITGLSRNLKFDAYHAMQNAGYFQALEDEEAFAKINATYASLDLVRSSHRLIDLSQAGTRKGVAKVAFEELEAACVKAQRNTKEVIVRINALLGAEPAAEESAAGEQREEEAGQ